MSDKNPDKDGLMEFIAEAPKPEAGERKPAVWRVLIIDDEKDVHSATTFALRNTEVVGRYLEFLHASSGREAKKMLQEHQDIAVILLDVVMETPNAGLDLVPTIRNELNIKDTRIILRTGQPNQAPEIEVIRDYDINDYKLKSELTQSRLYASLTTAIRSYKQIQTIEAGKQSLAMIVKSSSELLTQKGIHSFAQGVILHLSGLLSVSPEGLICARRRNRDENSAIQIIAAAGQYTPLIDRSLDELTEKNARSLLVECINARKHIIQKKGMALYLGSEDRGDMACYVSSDAEFDEIDEELLELFCANIAICADNLELVTQLSEFAFRDELTALPNRKALVDEINRCVKNGEVGEAVLCLIDIDNFAELNNSLGQTYGDFLLVAVAKRLREQFPEPCFVARLTGDSFALFGLPADLNENRLEHTFAKPFDIDGEEQSVSISAGIVPIVEVHGGGDEAVKDASIVLKTAKNSGRGQILAFRQNMVKDAQGRLALLRHLRAAFELEHLFMVFQPKLRFSDLKVTGFESLIRWRDKHGNLVSPQAFIPLAEQSGLIFRLGEWIYHESLSSLKEIHQQGWTDCQISVNLSVVQLRHEKILTMLRDGVESSGINPKYVNLEITESLAVSDFENTLTLLAEIKKMGFSIALDDFGTGYSSLNHLQKMPLDFIKIDQSLIHASDTDSGREIVEMIIHLCEKMGLQVIAEGVEKQRQVDLLKSLGCDQAQGFFYATPMEKTELLAWLKNHPDKKI